MRRICFAFARSKFFRSSNLRRPCYESNRLKPRFRCQPQKFRHGVQLLHQPQVQLADSTDLYDARRWESAYREMHDVPTILVQLQDDLSRSRKREAFWMSVVVHLVVVILIWNSPKFAKFFPSHNLVVNPE